MQATITKTKAMPAPVLQLFLALVLLVGLAPALPQSAWAADYSYDASTRTVTVTGDVTDWSSTTPRLYYQNATGPYYFISQEGVTKIYTEGLHLLKEVEVASTVTDMVFMDTSNVEKITFKGSTPPSTIKEWEATKSNLVIYVPSGSEDAYKAALPASVKDKIQTDPDTVSTYWSLSGSTLTIEKDEGIANWQATDPNVDDYYGQSDIKKIIIEDDVTTLGQTAFYGYWGLQEVVIGKGVTSIGNRAFGESDLRTIVFEGRTPPSTFHTASFSDLPNNGKNTTVTVPCGTLNAYKTAWKTAFNNNVTVKEAAHTPGAAVQENLIEATCTEAGSYAEVVKCTECGEEISRTSKTIAALGHTYENGVCTRCGEADPSAVAVYDVMAGVGTIAGGGVHSAYIGTYSGADVHWRILAATGGNGGTYETTAGTTVDAANAMFLFAYNNFEKSGYGSNGYTSSYLRSEQFSKYPDQMFSAIEKAAFLKTTVVPASTDPVAIDLTGNGSVDDAYDGVWYPDGVPGDQLFALSVDELTNTAYGFKESPSDGDQNRVPDPWSDRYWARNQFVYNSPNQANWVWGLGVNGNFQAQNAESNSYNYAHPGGNVDTSAILLTSKAEGGKESNGVGEEALKAVSATNNTDWVFTFLDNARDFTAETTAVNNDTLTITYTGAKSGTGEYVSAVIEDADGAITHYGNLKAISTAADESGTVTLNISGIADDAKIYVFSEQVNGDKKTDYASKFMEVSRDVPEYTITFGAATVKDGPGNYKPEVFITWNEFLNSGAVVEPGSTVEVHYRAVERGDNLEWITFAAVYTDENGQEQSIDMRRSNRFTMPAANVTIKAEVQWLYAVNVAKPENGTIALSQDGSPLNIRWITDTQGEAWVKPGNTVTVTATPATDYVLDELNVTGATLGDDNTFVMPVANVTVSASFAYDPCTASGHTFNNDGFCDVCGHYDSDADTYTISKPEYLAEISRAAAEDGETFAGKTLELPASLDISSLENFAPIGGATTKYPLTINSQEDLDAALEEHFLIYDDAGTSYVRASDKNQDYSSGKSYFYQTGSAFEGTFDGKGNEISGLNVQTDKGYAGLFGNVCGTVKDLTVRGTVASTTTEDFVGGIVGKLSAGGTISGCKSYVDVSSRGYNTGGVVGMVGEMGQFVSESNPIASVIDCGFYGSVTSAERRTGGIAGRNAGLIERCANHGKVSTSYARKNGVGGIAGWNGVNNEATDAGIIRDCYTDGDVDGNTCYWTGGIVGFQNAESVLENCYNASPILHGKKEGGSAYASTNAVIGQDEGTTSNIIWLNKEDEGTTIYVGLDTSGVGRAGNTQTNVVSYTEDQLQQSAAVEFLNSDGNNAFKYNYGGFPVLVWEEAAEAPEPEGFKITTQPVDATAALKQTAEFTIETNDPDAVYRWEYSEDGEKWGQSYLTGWKTSEFSFAVTAARADRLYRCKVTFSDGKVEYSDTVGVVEPKADESIKVTATPEKASAKLKDTVEFKATVEGVEDTSEYTFLWYYSEDSGENWAQSYLGGWKTDTFSFAVTSPRADRIYRVKATAPSGAEIFSEPVSIELASDTALSV